MKTPLERAQAIEEVLRKNRRDLRIAMWLNGVAFILGVTGMVLALLAGAAR